MNAIMNKTNNGKRLIAAVAILAMVACVFAVAMPSADAAPTTPTDNPFEGMYTGNTASYSNGVFSVTDDTVITLTKDVGAVDTPADFRIEITAGKTLTIQNSGETAFNVYMTYTTAGTATDASDPVKSVIYGGAKDSTYGMFEVIGNVNVYVTLDADADKVGADGVYLTNSHAIYNAGISLDDGAKLTVSQTSNAGGQSYWVGSTTTLATTTIAGGSQLVFSNANGISGVNASVSEGSAIIAEKTKTGKAWLNFNELTVSDEKSSVQVKDGSSMGVYITKSLNNSGTVDTGSAVIGTADKATITNNATGKISAAEIQGSTATITNNGELNAKAAIGDATTGYTYLSGAVSKDTLVAGNAILENVTVNPGVTLSVADKGNPTVKGDMRLYGTIAPATKDGTATITVGTDASLTAYNGSTISKGMNVIGTGKIDISAAMSTITVNDDVDMPFNGTQSQKVVIADTLTIKSGWTMEILGELVINEGCTLIIEDGASLVLGNGTVDASKMTVNGNIEVEQGGTIDVKGAEEVTVVGEITVSGTATINSNVTVKNGGKIVIDDTDPIMSEDKLTVVTPGSSIAVDANANFVIEAGGELSVAGSMDIKSISNKGTVTLNGAYIVESSTISLTANGAVIDIKSFTQAQDKTLTVNDDGMFLYEDDNDVDVIVQKANASKVEFKYAAEDVGVRNIKITAAVTSEKIDKDTTKYVSSLVLSGSVTILDDTDAGTFADKYNIEATGNVNAQSSDEYTLVSTIEVPESLTIGKNIVFTLAGGNMNVDGTITATSEGSQIVSGGTYTGEIYVNGMITIGIDNEEIKDGINAFNYEDEDYNYYTTLKTAVDNGATDIEYIGNVKVLDTLTLLADTELSKATNGGKITIGDEDNRDVIVTVADGATVRGCTIDVMATLVFDNNKTGNRTTNVISSDVIINAEPKRTYTNIYTALEDAADNSTISISRNIFLDKDAEVRATVTLEIVSPYGVYLDNGVTLTVNGTVKNGGSIGNAVDDGTNQPSTTGMLGFDPEVDDHAAIVVSGTVMSMEKLAYGTYYIVGAYYQLVNDQGSWYYITPVEAAATASNDVEKGAIDIYGENTVGDVSFTGDADQNVFVTVYGTLNAGTVTLDEAAIVVAGSFTGTAATENGTVDIENAKMLSVSNSTVDDAAVTYLAGTPVAADVKKDSSVAIVTGTVNIQDLIVGIMEMSKTTPSILEDTGLTAADEDVDSFAIASGATAVVSGEGATLVAGEMTVDGTLNVTEKGAITVDELTVRGTLNVASEDKENDVSAGSASINTLFVGIAKETDKEGINYFGDASAAAVTADEIKNLANIYVSAESTIAGDLTENMNTTQFFVEDALWMTIFTVDDDMAIDNSIQPGDLINSEFSYWTDADGNKIETSSKVYVGDVGYETVYAKLNYNIYHIQVYADPGIDAVYIDGTLMTGQTAGQMGWNSYVAAGNHEITYKLANGYVGNATMTVNGEQVSGYTFSCSGTSTDDKQVTIYLQGIDKGGYVPDSPDNGDSGLGLTDYLLIILVILIVVMAIMVAMRLMRS